MTLTSGKCAPLLKIFSHVCQLGEKIGPAAYSLYTGDPTLALAAVGTTTALGTDLVLEHASNKTLARLETAQKKLDLKLDTSLSLAAFTRKDLSEVKDYINRFQSAVPDTPAVAITLAPFANMLAEAIDNLLNSSADQSQKLLLQASQEQAQTLLTLISDLPNELREQTEDDLQALEVTLKADLYEISESLILLHEKIGNLDENMEEVLRAFTNLTHELAQGNAKISDFPREQLEQALAEKIDWSIEKYRSVLAAAQTSSDNLLLAKAHLLQDENKSAIQKAELVLEAEADHLVRIRQALEVKAQVLLNENQFTASLQIFQKIISLIDKEVEPLSWADFQFEISCVLSALARHEEAQKVLSEVLEVRRKKLPKNDPSITDSLIAIAGAYYYRGMYREALRFTRESLSIKEKCYGKGSVETVAEINLQALAYKEMAQAGKAEKLYRRALSIHERCPTNSIFPKWVTLNNLCSLLLMNGQSKSARPFLEEAMTHFEENNQTNNSHYSTLLNCLGRCFKLNGDLSNSEKKYREAMKIDLDLFGQDHPSVARDKANLSLLLCEQGRFLEAELMIKSAISFYEDGGGENLATIAEFWNSFSLILGIQGRYPEALIYAGKTVVLHLKFEKENGREHTHFRTCFTHYLELSSQSLSYKKSVEGLLKLGLKAKWERDEWISRLELTNAREYGFEVN